MSTSQLRQTVQHYRSLLLQHEQHAVAQLESAYAHTLSQIQPQLNHLYQQIAARQQAGESIPPSWIYQRNRLQATKQVIEEQINRYGATAQQTTQQLQHQGVSLGLQSAQSQLQATVPTGISYSFGVPHPAALENLVGATQAGSPLADLFAGFGKEAADGVGKALLTGLALGENPRTVARAVQTALGVSRNRALVIARQEMIRTYRSANLETYRANSDAITGWRWSCSFSARTCVACLAEDGSEHGLDEDMESHICCRCVMVPITKSWDDILGPLGIDTSDMEDMSEDDSQTGAQWFDEQDASVQQSILGPSAYDLYASGNASLQDFVGVRHDAIWGNSIYVKSVKQLTKG